MSGFFKKFKKHSYKSVSKVDDTALIGPLTLTNCGIDDVSWFDWSDITECKCLEVFDCNKLILAIQIDSKIYKIRCELYGIVPDDLYKFNSINLLEKRLLNKICRIECHNLCPSNILIATVFLNEININKLLVKNKYAISTLH